MEAGDFAPTRMSNFSATCNRLSQFIKENKMGLSASSMAMDLGAAARRPPVTKNLLQCLDVPLVVDDQRVARLFPQQAEEIKSVQQLTIFYGGKMLVFDDFPADKAKLLMDMAATTTTTTTPAAPPSIACPPAGELALAGRRSLRRFFEKRKYRISSKAPYYRLNGSPCSLPANKAEVFSQSQHAQPQPWLDWNHNLSSDFCSVLKKFVFINPSD